jgi:hypothetical protein
MMEMEDRYRVMFDKSMQAHAEREQQWWKQDRRGRWVVLERGPGHLLTDSPRHIRDYVDAITEQRGRRFSSLSRARKFAHEVDGVVRRWRRQMPKRGAWRLETNPWERAVRMTPLWICAPKKKDDGLCCEPSP